VLDLLAHLVDKSLVVFEQRDSETRYWMMETIRQYARDRVLESTEVETIRDHHLDFFVALAEEVEPKLRGPEQMQWLDRLDLEHDNLRAALEWSLGEGRVEKGLRLGAALAWFWERCGYWMEGQERVESLLNQPEATAKTLIRANGLFAASVLTSSLGAAWVGGSNASRPYLEEAIAIAREHGQAGKRLCALALTFLSNNLHAGNPALAQSQYDDAWAIAQELGDQWIVAFLVHQRGHWFADQRNYKAARNAFEDSMMLFRSVGDKRWAAILFSDIADVCFVQGDLAGARLRLEQNLPYFRETKDRQHICFTLMRLGEIARAEGSFDLAKRFYMEGLAIARDLGSKMQIGNTTSNLGFVAVHDGELDSARSLFVESLARARELDSKPMVAFALLGFASVAAAEKKTQRAVHLLAVVDALLEGGDKGSLDPVDEAEYQRNLAIARQQLDEATFNAAWAEGQKMTLEQAIELAMKDE
jgi:tetratricopeptide (TPR) repeat protein